MSGRNYTYMTTDVSINQDEASSLFDGVINDLRISIGERREELLQSPLSAKVNEFVIEQSAGEDNTDESYVTMLNAIKFISTQDGSFIITAGPMHQSLERFSMDMFKDDLLNRASLTKPVTGMAGSDFKLPINPSTSLPRDPVTLEEQLKSTISERTSRLLGPDGQLEGP